MQKEVLLLNEFTEALEDVLAQTKQKIKNARISKIYMKRKKRAIY